MKEKEKESDLGLFILGALVGAGLAMLFAPESGSDQRHRISQWLHEHGGSGHDILVKVKKMLHIRHNGIAVNGHSKTTRRHGRS
jgi:gas vesicle protein